MERADNTIYLGLCMAGAISAGAYTAGVMDYLLEALEEWERRKASGVPGTPTHSVVIPVIGGASAGGMTGLMAAAAMNNHVEPVRSVHHSVIEKRPYNKFYHTWVDMVADDMIPHMLDTSDIENGKIQSLLNSSFIDQIADMAMEVDPDRWVRRPYIADKLKLFVTLSNLEGFSYYINFQSGGHKSGRYIIKKHADFACFLVNNNGSGTTSEDGWIPLDFRTKENVDFAKSAAMATGAFPVGLRPRRVSRLRRFVEKNAWMGMGGQYFVPKPDPYDTLNVDGGLVNNEPFERVRELLSNITGEEAKHYNNFDSVRSMVLLIDPFPSTEDVFDAGDGLLKTIGYTFSAMMGQLRIKPEHVMDALDTDCAGQFMIAPKRKVPVYGDGVWSEIDEHGEKAIACGSLGGFGGFLHKEFRVHDFFLGRANCERFLRHHFTVPCGRDNTVLREGYRSVENKAVFTGENGLQIIPVFSPEGKEFYMPPFAYGKDWPLRRQQDIDRLRPQVRARIDRLIMNAAELNARDRFLLWGGKVLFLRRKFTNYVMKRIEKSLTEHRLIIK